MNENSLNDLINQNAHFSGRAENAKGGAVVVLRNQEVIYIRNLSSWEERVVGKQGSQQRNCLQRSTFQTVAQNLYYLER